MDLTRRTVLAGLAAGALRAPAQNAQRQIGPGDEKPRGAPSLCLYSQPLIQLPYADLGPVLRDLGFDGCDLTVTASGHVQPEKAPADLVRAVEGIRGEGVDVPMLSTELTAASQPWAATVVAIAGMVKVPVFTTGYWRYGTTPIDTRLAEVQRDVLGLAALGKAYQVSAALHNLSGDYVGASVWDTRILLADLDPRYSGYCFDPCHATVEGGAGGWERALRIALPRLKAVVLQDFYWKKESGGAWSVTPCPLGEGMVNWSSVFTMLTQAGFTGPLSLRPSYAAKDHLAAIARDREFAVKQLGAARRAVT